MTNESIGGLVLNSIPELPGARERLSISLSTEKLLSSTLMSSKSNASSVLIVLELSAAFIALLTVEDEFEECWRFLCEGESFEELRDEDAEAEDGTDEGSWATERCGKACSLGSCLGEDPGWISRGSTFGRSSSILFCFFDGVGLSAMRDSG